MLQIDCPFCGKREHSEFRYGGAAIEYPALDASIEQWHDAVFMRENVRGMQAETWQHVHGCRLWLVVERDTMTHQIHSVRAADHNVQALLTQEKAANTNTTNPITPSIDNHNER